MKKRIAAVGAAGALALAAFAGTAAANSDPGNSGHAPDCTKGQKTATVAQFNGENVNVGQVIRHGVYTLACAFNVPPGQLNN